MSKKICLLVGSLSSGGAEKVAANMSISLKNRGYDVYVVTMRDKIDYKYEGRLYNFGQVKAKYGKLVAFFKFKKYFKKNQFDIIIDHRTRSNFLKEVLFSKFVFQRFRVVYCVHNYLLDYYFSYIKFPWISRFPHVKNSEFVSVCNGIKKRLEEKLNVNSVVIYNFIKLEKASSHFRDDQEGRGDYIIGVGRLTKIKQFDKLIVSYANSKLPEKGIKLVILGNGPEKENLKELVFSLKLEEHVGLLPFRENPNRLIGNAKALVLTSKVEGLPMVLLEAVSLNSPIIAFNCKSGPDEIIKNGVNGVLVENQNTEQLTLVLNKLLLDKKYYAKIKNNASNGLEKFSEENVVQDWMNLFENQKNDNLQI